ncbi:MAG: phosphoribosylaminoimidazolesuccinocarboxamide synthase [Patescibacteria group bacterium]
MPTQEETAAIAAELAKQHPGKKFEHLHSGKVREIFGTDGGLVMIATDRISGRDVVMGERIPDKGVVLNSISAWMFRELGDVVEHHLLNSNFLPVGPFAGRASFVRKLTPVPAECIVRALITGSMWSAFKKAEEADGIKTVLGFDLPAGLRESEMFPEPLFTPSTKAEVGHDENLTEAETRALLNKWAEGLPDKQKRYWAFRDLFGELKRVSLELFGRGSEYASERGIILADTKLEFGLDESGELVLMDEVLTPDSSRFVFEEDYVVGEKLVCQDKQILRDYLDEVGWDRNPPPPELPEELIGKIRSTYVDMHQRITGNQSLAA